MAFSSFGLPAPGLAAPGLAPQLNLNGGQQGQGLMLAAARGGGGEERLWLGQIPGAKPQAPGAQPPQRYTKVPGTGNWRWPESNLNALNQGFSVWWSRMYHGKARPDTIHPRLETFQRGERQPIKGAENEDALKNMDAAVAVFLDDKITAPKEFLDFLGVKEGALWTEDLLKKILIRTGSVETGFNPEQKKQIIEGGGIGRGRSYWQVEPETALSLLTRSKNLFQKKFEDRFSDKYGKQASEAGYKGKNAVRDWLASFNKEKMSEILFEDGDLAATLAMGKWNAALQNLVKENAERIMAEAQALEQGLG
jgi:hypothetical protein